MFLPFIFVQSKDNSFYLKNVTGFPLGVAVDGEQLPKNKTYRDLVAKEFNSVSTENNWKMYRVHPELNRYDFSLGDSIVALAQRNQMRVHDHTLVWFDHFYLFLYGYIEKIYGYY